MTPLAEQGIAVSICYFLILVMEGSHNF